MKEEVYYFDENGNSVDDYKDAKKVIIRYLYENGMLIKETFGELNKDDEEKEEEIPEFTQEEYDQFMKDGFVFEEGTYKIVNK